MLLDRLLGMSLGHGAYPEPTQFQLTTAARLVDKALRAWDRACSDFEDHSRTRDGMPPLIQAMKPGVTPAWFRAIDELESLVDSLYRALKLVEALQSAPELTSLATNLPTRTERGTVYEFRKRIQHGHNDIADGKAGQGLATATLAPDTSGMELQHRRLEYANLATMLEQLHDLVRAASEKT